MCSSSAQAAGRIFLKVSSGTSATAETDGLTTRRTAQSSAKRPPTPTTVEQFALAGPSDLPDPRFHAFRKDLADAALAGRVIASHYADPVKRHVRIATPLLDGPAADASPLAELSAGDLFLMLDDSLGWVWGYAGEDRRVGYLPSEVLTS